MSLSWSVIQLWFSRTLATPVFTIGGQGISLLWIIKVVALLILVSIVARGIKRFLKQYLLILLRVSEGNREVIGTLSGLGLGTLGYILVLQEMGLDLTSKPVENWNYENCQGRIDISISVASDSDPLLVTEILLESAFMENEVLASPPPKVVFLD